MTLEPIMSAISTPSATASLTSPLASRPTAPRSTGRARWALVAAFAVGVAGGAGTSAGLVHSQVRIVHDIDTVYVPVPSNPLPPASGNLQRKV